MDELDLGIVERRIAEGDYLAARVIMSNEERLNKLLPQLQEGPLGISREGSQPKASRRSSIASSLLNWGRSGGLPQRGTASEEKRWVASEVGTPQQRTFWGCSDELPADEESMLQAIAVRKLQLLPLREWEDEQRARREDFFRSIGDVVETVVSVFQHSERDHQDLLKFFRGRAKADKEAARALKHCSVHRSPEGHLKADLIRQASTGNSSILSELSPRRLPEAPLWEEWDDAAREGCGTSRRKPAGSNEGNKNSGTPPWVSEAFEQMRADSGSGPDAISSASVAAVSATGITSAVSLAAEPHVSGGQQFVEVQGVSMLATATPEASRGGDSITSTSSGGGEQHLHSTCSDSGAAGTRAAGDSSCTALQQQLCGGPLGVGACLCWLGGLLTWTRQQSLLQDSLSTFAEKDLIRAWRSDALRQICEAFILKAYSHCTAAAVTLERVAETLEQPSGLASDEQPVVQQQQHQHGAADKRKSVASFTLLTDMPGPNEGPPGGTIRNGSRPLQGESCQVSHDSANGLGSSQTRRLTFSDCSKLKPLWLLLKEEGLLQEKNAGQVPPPFRCSLLCAAAETLAREEPPPRSPLLLRRGMAELHIGGLSSLLSRWQPAIVCLSKSRLLHFFACAEEEVPIRTFFVGGAERWDLDDARLVYGWFSAAVLLCLAFMVLRFGFGVYEQEKKRRGFLPRSSLVFRVNGSRECKEWLSVLEMAADDRAFLASAQDINTGHAAPVDACEPPSYASRIVKGTPGDPSATFYSNNSNSAEAYGVQHLMPYPAATGMQHLDVGAHIPSGSMDEVSLDEPPS
ncbi:hypothetical protein cyc_04840 [Cyclospora cayetanensis]|uniref:Transmembrane protein n=1 Tax=Cyclospora cayetanensis TaxID=88456 RepID=A0A1D3D4H8_9EIME|nr:hypothetical protein cyc_04840 [Cyclospora cayetanensis]